MEFLSLKDQSDGTRTHRGSWEEDNEARLELYNRAKAMLLQFEKRRARLSRTVSFCFILLILVKFFLLGGRCSSFEAG